MSFLVPNGIRKYSNRIAHLKTCSIGLGNIFAATEARLSSISKTGLKKMHDSLMVLQRNYSKERGVLEFVSDATFYDIDVAGASVSLSDVLKRASEAPDSNQKVDLLKSLRASWSEEEQKRLLKTVTDAITHYEAQHDANETTWIAAVQTLCSFVSSGTKAAKVVDTASVVGSAVSSLLDDDASARIAESSASPQPRRSGEVNLNHDTSSNSDTQFVSSKSASAPANLADASVAAVLEQPSSRKKKSKSHGDKARDTKGGKAKNRDEGSPADAERERRGRSSTVNSDSGGSKSSESSEEHAL
jgi:hypothetical protein